MQQSKLDQRIARNYDFTLKELTRLKTICVISVSKKMRFPGKMYVRELALLFSVTSKFVLDK